jgi:hypothetical protein
MVLDAIVLFFVQLMKTIFIGLHEPPQAVSVNKKILLLAFVADNIIGSHLINFICC